MLCKDVRLARVGTMVYRASELKTADGSQLFEGDASGIVHIERDADVVFSQQTMDSFVGKSITIKHPEKIVDTKSHRDLSHGHVLNTRRGSGNLSDFLVGDILVTTDEGIAALDSLREVSCGYDADYEKISPNRGRQTKIVGNHLALVERGRCGPNCYVGDQDMSVEEESDMTTKADGLSFIKKLLGASTNDEAAKMIADEEARQAQVATADAIAALTKQVGEMAAQIAALTADKEDEEDEEEEEGEKAETKDAAITFDAATQPLVQTRVASAAEKLVPGHTVPALTTDAAVCECQRDVLTKAYATDAGKKAIDAVLGGVAFDAATMTSDMLGATFYGASHIAGLGNNAAIAATLAGHAGSEFMNSANRSEAAQKASNEKWAKRREERDRHIH